MCYRQCKYENYDGECRLEKGEIPQDDSDCAINDRAQCLFEELQAANGRRIETMNMCDYFSKRIGAI